jgi:hypothetical protein
VQEIAVIHTLADVPGARSLIKPNHNQEAEGALELFEGGSLADVVAAASAVAPPAQGGRWGVSRGAQRGQNRLPSVHVYHGICAWSEGQLEGAPFVPLPLLYAHQLCSLVV